MNQKSITMSGMSGINFVYILNACFIIAVSIYLTNHYYATMFPENLGGGASLCDISQYFNCDSATYSPLASIAGVPTSFFGLVMGLLFLFSSIFPSLSMEKTASFLSKINFIGCVVLFIYSLFVLKSLCPFCSIYYLLSFIAFFLLSKYGVNSWQPEIKSVLIWGVILLIGSFFISRHTQSKSNRVEKINQSIISQYQKLADLGEPQQESPYKIHMSTPNWMDAPIRLTVFSDFQCPFCKLVADQVPALIRKYPGKINVQYFFYPLDSKCNSNMKRPAHQYACEGAYLAACDKEKFLAVHDDIFSQQEKIDSSVLKDISKKHGLTNCDSEEIKNTVISLIEGGAQFNLKSTPTLILNGKKIEGSIPNNQYFAIFDYLLENAK